MTMAKRRCDECRWWEMVQNRDLPGRKLQYGLCRRFPPTIKGREAETYDIDRLGYVKLGWRIGEPPTTHMEDWCGEWEAKPDGEA